MKGHVVYAVTTPLWLRRAILIHTAKVFVTWRNLTPPVGIFGIFGIFHFFRRTNKEIPVWQPLMQSDTSRGRVITESSLVKR